MNVVDKVAKNPKLLRALEDRDLRVCLSRDYDMCFIYKIMSIQLYKLAMQVQLGYNINSNKMANRIRICAAACNRLYKDNYKELCPSWIKLEREYPNWADATHRKIVGPDEEIMYEVELTELSSVTRKLLTQSTLEEDRQRKQDLELIGTYLLKYSTTWWD